MVQENLTLKVWNTLPNEKTLAIAFGFSEVLCELAEVRYEKMHEIRKKKRAEGGYETIDKENELHTLDERLFIKPLNLGGNDYCVKACGVTSMISKEQARHALKHHTNFK